MAKLRMGYFEEFKGGDTILISGDSEGLEELATLLRGLEDLAAGPLHVHTLPFVTLHHGVRLVAYPVDRELGVRREGKSRQTPVFSWHRSSEGWLEAAEKIETVARGGGGHNFLDAASTIEDAVVMVSKGEYDDEWWRRRG